ncbi:MAG: DUF2312 domain-containing protein [Rickettsiaceae bacterium]|nr:DUF2312 domain-containing protein [Rickettsiaceae bacterium]
MTEVFAKEELINYINSLENMEREKSETMDAIKDIFLDAKSKGFDIKILKHILKLRKMDKNTLAETDALIELYRDAAGI